MKTKADNVLFEFDPKCPQCGTNCNNDKSDSTIQLKISDILYTGPPNCYECGEDLDIENECEVTV